MPIYEYQCGDCGHEFEIIQKMTDSPIKQCPKCFNNSAKKLVSAAGFQLKGSGWYETDFKTKKKPATESNADSNSKADSSKKTEATKKPKESDN